MNIANLKLRSDFARAIRNGFYAQGFMEVATPVRIAAPAPEEYIEAVESEGKYLRTSPELEMKQLLSLGAERIFQLGSCFRADEFGRKHRTEFTILEYYSTDWDYRQLAEFTRELFARSAREVKGSTIITYQGNKLDLAQMEYITVDEAFRRYTGISAFEADDNDTFDELMVTKIEPNLGVAGLTCLTDYPISRASLSRRSEVNPSISERWELYAQGVELGNAFGELTDGQEQRRRFAASQAFRRSHHMHDYPEPEGFYQALNRGLPECSGCALGFDRLLMLLADTADIGDVLFDFTT